MSDSVRSKKSFVKSADTSVSVQESMESIKALVRRHGAMGFGVLAWAEGVRISEGLLANVLDGSMLIRLGADGQPTFELSPRGKAEIEAQLQEMGVPL